MIDLLLEYMEGLISEYDIPVIQGTELKAALKRATAAAVATDELF